MNPDQLFTLGTSQYSLGIGFIVGFAFKKLLKLALFIGGLYVASLYYLAQKGIITIDPQKLQQLAQEATNTVLHYAFSTGYAIANFAGATVGFLIGWKLA